MLLEALGDAFLSCIRYHDWQKKFKEDHISPEKQSLFRTCINFDWWGSCSQNHCPRAIKFSTNHPLNPKKLALGCEEDGSGAAVHWGVDIASWQRVFSFCEFHFQLLHIKRHYHHLPIPVFTKPSTWGLSLPPKFKTLEKPDIWLDEILKIARGAEQHCRRWVLNVIPVVETVVGKCIASQKRVFQRGKMSSKFQI